MVVPVISARSSFRSVIAAASLKRIGGGRE